MYSKYLWLQPIETKWKEKLQDYNFEGETQNSLSWLRDQKGGISLWQRLIWFFDRRRWSTWGENIVFLLHWTTSGKNHWENILPFLSNHHTDLFTQLVFYSSLKVRLGLSKSENEIRNSDAISEMFVQTAKMTCIKYECSIRDLSITHRATKRALECEGHLAPTRIVSVALYMSVNRAGFQHLIKCSQHGLFLQVQRSGAIGWKDSNRHWFEHRYRKIHCAGFCEARWDLYRH